MSANYFLFLAITRLVVLHSVESDFTIYRGDIRRGTDRFTMTPSFCKETAGNGDVCGQFYAVNNTNGRRCDCLCPYHRSTFIFHNFRWMCLPNDILRCRQGCKYFFKDETITDPLKILQNFRKRLLNLNVTQRCQLDLHASRYEQCGKLWRPLTKDGTPSKRFSLATFRDLYQLLIKDGKEGSLNGQIIKLAINCSSHGSASDESCVLLKLRGTGSATTPTQATPALLTMGCPTSSSSPLLPSPSVSQGPQAAWSSSISPVTQSKVGPVVNSSLTVSTVRTPLQSSSVAFVFPGGKHERDNKARDSSLKAAIVGPTVAAGVIILVMALAFVYYRRKTRNKSTKSLSSSGLIPEKQQQSVSFNPMLDDALYLLPSDMGIQNSQQRGTASSRSISNPVYDRGNDTSIQLKCGYAHPCKRIPVEPQRNSNSEVPGVENQAFVDEEYVYSEAWVLGTPRGIISDVSKEHLTSTPQSEEPAASDHRTPASLHSDKVAHSPPFYVVQEESKPHKPSGVVDDEKYQDAEMQDKTQSPASLYDVVEGIIFGGADIDGECLVSANPLYEYHTFVNQSLDSVERSVNDYQEVNASLYDVIEQHEAADDVTEGFREAPVYDTPERPIYEVVRSEGPRHHGNVSMTGGGVCFKVDNTEEDSSRRSAVENHETPAVLPD